MTINVKELMEIKGEQILEILSVSGLDSSESAVLLFRLSQHVIDCHSDEKDKQGIRDVLASEIMRWDQNAH